LTCLTVSSHLTNSGQMVKNAVMQYANTCQHLQSSRSCTWSRS